MWKRNIIDQNQRVIIEKEEAIIDSQTFIIVRAEEENTEEWAWGAKQDPQGENAWKNTILAHAWQI